MVPHADSTERNLDDPPILWNIEPFPPDTESCSARQARQRNNPALNLSCKSTGILGFMQKPGSCSPLATLCVLLGFLSVLTGCGSGTAGSVAATAVSTSTPVPAPNIWVGAWSNAMTNADANAVNTGGMDRTFRFLLYPTIGGTQERVRFSNYYGTTPVTIGAARLATGTEGTPQIDVTQDAALLFNGQASVTIAPGQVIVSDPVKITFTFGQALAVSMYLKGSYGLMSRHNSIFTQNYQGPAGGGDMTADSSGTGLVSAHDEWLLLNGVDVYGQYQGTLILFGSSTTDGYHSNYSDDKIYPVPNTAVDTQHTSRLSDWLARRLNAAGYNIGVVNLGVPGDTVTDDITNTLGHVENANQRIGHDALTVPNPLAMVTYFGSIDIRSPDCQSAPAIEAATTRMVAQAHAASLPVLLATIPPSAFCTNPAEPNYGPLPSAAAPYNGGVAPGATPNGGEVQRLALNTWIRATGATLPGVVGIADFSAALTDPERQSFMQPQYNSGDNYHPNGNGYHAEANSIPLEVLPALPH